LNQRLFFWSLTAALAGFLFGFDTVVISGAEKTIQNLWKLDVATHGLAVSIALWGTVIGSLVGGWPTDRFGRKKTLIGIGILYLASAIWSAIAADVNSFMIARFIGGLGVGISTIAAPLYISEISPADRRGQLAGMFQFNIVFGVLIAFLSNYLIGEWLEEAAWRWMLGIEAFPAVVYTLLCFGIPQSPRWLISKKNNREAAIGVLRKINPDSDDAEIAQLADEIEAASNLGHENTKEPFFSSRLRIPIMLAFLVAFFNQLSGINAILYFAPRIFELAGFSESGARQGSIGIGVVNLLFTFVGLYLIDRLGRRTLLYIGSFGYIAALGICAWAFFNYATPFNVANKAISLKNSVQAVAKLNALDAPLQADLKEATAAVIDAKAALAKAVGAQGFNGTPVDVDATHTNQQLTAIASAAVKEAGDASGSGGNTVLWCIFGFIAAHAVGQGAVIWVLISEIFPNRHRAAGQAFGCFTHWIFAAMLTFAFPWMIGAFPPGYVFGFFCFMMVLQLIWVATMVVETKGVPLEKMQEKLGVV